MKKADFFLIAGIVVFCLLITVLNSLSGRRPGNMLEITIDGELYGTWSLNENRIIEIGDGNTCEIKNGSVRMTAASCPDQYCINSRPIDRDGGSIVCLPNKVILKINGESDDLPDTIAG